MLVGPAEIGKFIQPSNVYGAFLSLPPKHDAGKISRCLAELSMHVGEDQES